MVLFLQLLLSSCVVGELGQLKKLQFETCYIANTGQWCCVIVLRDEEWVSK